MGSDFNILTPIDTFAKNFNPRSRVGSDAVDREHVPETKISIHAPAWGATALPRVMLHLQAISIHAPAWGATTRCLTSSSMPQFQSTLPRGERHLYMRDIAGSLEISIHAPAWGATTRHRHSLLLPRYFNPRSRVGSDGAGPRGHARNRDISIHAPAWGATRRHRRYWSTRHISIHAPAWGATFSSYSWICLRRISIHAPAWGATVGGKGIHARQANFNPRSRVGSDSCASAMSRFACIFQSTLPRGERRARRCLKRQTINVFQSTLPRGERREIRILTNQAEAFQSTLPRGERLGQHRAVIMRQVFQSTLPRGERHNALYRVFFGGHISIHAPAWGAT